MLKKFTDGLIFGGGFAISFIVIWYFAAYFIYPIFIGSQIERATTKQLSEYSTESHQPIPPSSNEISSPRVPFYELDLEEQIKQASVIALARYEPATDGKMKAIIKEFLKKEPKAIIYYNIGDEYPTSSYYPKADTNYGDGIIMFFTGSPAMMKYSTTYHGDRIGGLGDLPVELLRKKCDDNKT